MMAANALNDEETNHLRAVYLCYRVAPESIRTYFDKQHPPSQLVNELAAERSNLQNINGRILKQYQWDQLYPPTGRSLPASTNFDITLLICLLRNMKPTIHPPPFGFDNLPHSSHTTVGAHLARIKYYRNHLAHSTDGKLSNTDFGNLWTDLGAAIICLGGSSFVREVNDAKSRSLDNTLTEILRQLVEFDKQYDELSNTITELKDVMDEDNKQRTADVTRSITELEDEMSNLCSQMQQQITIIDKHSIEIIQLRKAIAAMEMENIPNNRKDLIRIHLEKWKKHDVMFIQTRAADKVYRMIKENCCLTVTGNSGIGKTMAVRHVALKMLAEGYTVVPISHPEEVVMLFSAQEKTLFVVDDLCGKYTLNHSYLDRVKLKLEDIKLLLEKQYCKIIATCRLQVFRDVKFKTLSMFNVCECNFNSEDINLTQKETSIFATQYFGVHADEGMTLSTDYDCFPFLCSVYHRAKGVDFYHFCKNPFQFFGEEIDNLLLEGDEGKYKYCILVLCVIYNNSLTEGCLTGTNGTAERQIIEEVLEECELNRGTPSKCLHNALLTLVGTFVSQDENCYKMVHDKLFDFLAFYIGKTMRNCLIEHADSGFIKERFLWDTTEDTTDFTITLSDDLIDSYINRMIRDWENKKVVEYFSNRNLRSPAFTDKVMCHLEKLNKDNQLQLANTVDADNLHFTSLMSSCQLGNVKLTRWILEKGNATETQLTSCLDMVCQEGNSKIVRELLGHGANKNKSDKDGWSPLYMACYNQQINVVRELLKDNVASIDGSCNLGRTTLNLSCRIGCLEITRDLLQHDADINKCDNYGWSPLHTACFYGRTNTVAELLKNGQLKIDFCDKRGRSPLYQACRQGYVQIVRKLLQYGADINTCENDGWSPLHISCYNNSKDLVIELLKNDNVKIEICDEDERSPLYLACQEGYEQIVRQLLKHGADINKCQKAGWSPLYTACYNKCEDVVTELLKNTNVIIDLCENKGCSPLYLACQKRYVQIVRHLLQHGADINKCAKDGWSPIHTACYNNCENVVLELLQNATVKIDIFDNKGRSPLYLACRQGYVQIVAQLLQHGADINECRNNGWSPLHTACFNKREDVVTELLKNENVKIDVCDNEGCSPFFLACHMGCSEIVRQLLKHGADINKCKKAGWSPLYTACYNKCKDVVTELLKNTNVIIDLCENNGCPPLYLACQKGYEQIVRHLLQHGADINKCAKDGWSPIHTACYNNCENVVLELLQNATVKIDIFDNKGRSPLYLACRQGYVQIVAQLLQHGADINECRNNGWSPLHTACFNKREYVVTELLKNDNVKIDVCDNEGCSPFFVACYIGCSEIVRQLLQRGTDINMCKKAGWSPLHTACYSNYENVVIELLANDNLKIDLCDKEGRSALYIACRKGYVQIVTQLVQHGADINKCSKNGSSPLHVACCNECEDVVTELLKYTDVKIDVCDTQGCSILYLACQKGNTGIVRELIQKGADLNKCDKSGISPLQTASLRGHENIVSLLLEKGANAGICKQDEISAYNIAIDYERTTVVSLISRDTHDAAILQKQERASKCSCIIL